MREHDVPVRKLQIKTIFVRKRTEAQAEQTSKKAHIKQLHKLTIINVVYGIIMIQQTE